MALPAVTQFMPDTARAVARQMKLTTLEGLNDGEVREALKNNPNSRATWRCFIWPTSPGRMDDKLAAAFVGTMPARATARAYHQKAWPPSARNTHAVAAGQPDPRQRERMATAKRTSEYVLDMFRRLGADAGRGGVSINGAYRTGGGRRAGSATPARRTGGAGREDMIAEQGQQRSALAAMYGEGFAADDRAAVARLRAPLEFAAAQGDAQREGRTAQAERSRSDGAADRQTPSAWARRRARRL